MPGNLQKAKSMFFQTGNARPSYMENVDDLVSETLDWLFRFKSLALQQEYVVFNKSRTSTRSTWLLSVLLTIFTIPYLIFILFSLSKSRHGSMGDLEVAMAAVSAFCVPVILILLWMVYYVQWAKSHKYSRQYPHSFTSKHLLHHLSHIQTCAYAIMISYYCFRLIIRVINGQCDDRDGQNSLTAWACNPLADRNSLPQDSMLSIIFIPMMLSLIWKEVDFTVVCVCWLMTVIAFVFSAVYARAFGMLPLMLAYLFAGPLAYYEYLKQNIIMFAMNQKLRDALDDNEKMADEVHANEMRSMIGNVAHDLKTPLTSFVNGIDFIDQVTKDLKEVATIKKSITPIDLEECVQSITTCVQNIKNTNSFMLMTINRCIDYTKASKGVKLVPKYDTFDLMESLNLPLNCMKDIQSRVTIRLIDISDDICSHIITDRQWLQENVLCLLSNAVKYSTEGEVTLKLSLKRNFNADGTTGMFDQMKALFFTNGGATASTDAKKVDEQENAVAKRIASLDDSTVVGQYQAREDSNKNLSSIHTDGAKPVPFGESGAAAKYVESPPTTIPPAKTNHRRHSSVTVSECVLLIEVEDHGVGIDESIMEHLFTPFKQAQRLAGGTGLGLFSLAKRVEALNGRCGVSGRRDGEQGSLFWFEIPYRSDKIYAALHKKVADRRSSILRTSMTLIPSSTVMATMTTSLGHRGSAKILPTMIGTQSSVVDMIAEHMEMSDLSLRTSSVRDEVSAVNNHSPSKAPPPSTPLIAEVHPETEPDANKSTGSGPSPVVPFTAPPPSVKPVVAPTPALPKGKKGSPYGELKILVVDDAPSIVKMTSMMLKRHGHAITAAENGEEALKRIFDQVNVQSVPFDVILMDLQMPVMDGLEAARRLRALEKAGGRLPHHGAGIRSSLLQSISKTKMGSSIAIGVVSTDSGKGGLQDLADAVATATGSTPRGQHVLSGLHHIIIGVSACSDDETTDAAYESGFDAFLPKPFSIDTFYETFQRLRAQGFNG